MKVGRILWLVVLIFFINGIGYSQKKKTDVEIIDFGDGGKSKAKDPVKYNNSIVKINPFSVVYGKIFAEYEREVVDWLSVQGGLGMTIQPFVEHSISSIIEDFDFGGEQYYDSKLWVNDYPDTHTLADKEFREGKVGIMANADIRLFPLSDGFEGSYISFHAEYANYNFNGRKVLELRNNAVFEEDFTVPESANLLDLGVRYGYQTLHPKLTTEYFIGGALRTKYISMADIGQDANFVYRNGIADYNVSTFVFQAGIRIGFQL